MILRRKHLSVTLSMTLLLSSLSGSFASAATQPNSVTPATLSSVTLQAQPSWGYFVDHYKNNSSVNMDVYSNPAIGILSGYNELWTPGPTWEEGIKLNSTVLDANIQKVVDMAATRTASDADAAYYDDRRKQSYSIIDGLGSLTDVYRTNAGATTTIIDIPADATTIKYEDQGNNSGDPDSSLGQVVSLVNTVRGSHSSTNPAKNYFSYKRPYRWTSPSLIVPTLVPAISKTPQSDGGFPSGHTNAAYLAALAMAYAIPERFQELLTRASEIGNNRIISGMHSPLDVMGGRVMATALSAAILSDPDNASLKQAAYDNARSELLTQTGTAVDRFSDYSKNKEQYSQRLTYGFDPIHSTTNTAVVPKGAEVLLETRQPYLDSTQRRWVLATTALPSGYPVLDDPEGWGRLDLFSAADGYGAFANDVTVTMDTYDGGFNALDHWRNDISGTGKLTKEGTGHLKLQGNNSYSGGTQINEGTLEGNSETAFGSGDVATNGGTLIESVFGKMTLGGDYSQSANGTLELNLSGENDLLEIKGAVTPNGKLRLNFSNNYVPNNDVITVISHGKDQRNGEFTSIETVGLPSQYNVKLIYNSDSIQVAVDTTGPSSPAPTETSQPNTGNVNPGPSATPAPSLTPESTPVPTMDNQQKPSLTVTATADSSGKAVAILQDSQINDLLGKVNASVAAKIVAQFKIEAVDSATAVGITLSKDAISKLSASKAVEVEIATPFASMTFNKSTLDALNKSAGDKITIVVGVADTAALTTEAKSLIGTRPVLEFTVESGATKVTHFEDGSLKISIPYTLAPGEDNNAIAAYYIDESGKPTVVTKSGYSQEKRTLSWVTDHLSKYAIGYNKINFRDTGNHWGSSYITYLAAHNIVSGKGDNMFSPNTGVTRAEFAKMLAGIENADVSAYKTSQFADIQAGDWHMPYVAWAADHDIVKGVENNNFNPNAPVSREELSVMIKRYADFAGHTLSGNVNDVAFGDSSSISTWAVDAVTTLQRAGIISGKSNHQFDPQSGATRAEAAKILTVLLQGLMN